MSDLGTMGSTYRVGRAINDAGQVTENSANNTYSENRAFVYDGITMRDLNLLSFVTPLPKWLRTSHGINDVGQIIANGDDGRG